MSSELIVWALVTLAPLGTTGWPPSGTLQGIYETEAACNRVRLQKLDNAKHISLVCYPESVEKYPTSSAR